MKNILTRVRHGRMMKSLMSFFFSFWTTKWYYTKSVKPQNSKFNTRLKPGTSSSISKTKITDNFTAFSTIRSQIYFTFNNFNQSTSWSRYWDLDVLMFLNEKMSSYTPLLIKSQEKKIKINQKSNDYPSGSPFLIR